MNIKKVITVGIMAVAASAMALDYCEVTGVNARQRYPWNGLVDIDFTLDSKATEPYLMNVTVFDNVGKTNLPVKTVYTENVSQKSNPCMVTKDTSRIVWNAAADLPDGFKCTNVLVTCQDTRTMVPSNLYMIVDLSGGSSAASFPVSYTNCPPFGGWTEEYMTTKLVLRRVDAGSFTMGSNLSSDSGHRANEVQHEVYLSHPYYLGVYEITASQYALIYGGSGSDTQPVQKDWYTLRGKDITDSYTKTSDNYTSGGGQYDKYVSKGETSDYAWPFSQNVAPSSFFGKLRAKTGLLFDLPTEAQWEKACRGGTITPLYIGDEVTTANKALIQGGAKPDPTGDHLIYVGQYMPNSFGLYDMQGNVTEWCLDVYVENLGTGDVADPTGGTTVTKDVCVVDTAGYAGGQQVYLAGFNRVVRGNASSSRSAYRWYNRVLNPSPKAGSYTAPVAGVRVALTVEE